MPETVIQRIGRYEILEEIGRGAMGVVFKGRDPAIGRAVAVKTITSGFAESGELLERFYREARAAGGLQHPNIVTIYELAESGGAPYIAMEYLEGESLDKLIARRPALSLGTKVGYVAQICRALDHAHRHGVIHRDVKPANIVVTRDGIVKVVDFGIARLGDTSKTQTGTLVGTLAYLSPERVRGEQADPRGDIWAVGVVLYELLTYQRPFVGENHAALLMSILQKEPASIRQFLPQCPAGLERAILKSLHKDEKQRYASMEALLKDIERAERLLNPGAFQASSEGTHAGEQSKPQPAFTVLLPSTAISSAGAVGVSAPPAQADTHHGAKPAPQPALRPQSSRVRTAMTAFALIAVIAISSVAIVRRNETAAAAAQRAWARIMNLASPRAAAHALPTAAANPASPAPAAAANTQARASDAASEAAGAAADTSEAAPPAGSSLEDQQRYLINLAQQAAGWQDYKTAQAQLDEAARLNGPLNDQIADLRQQFTAQAHNVELDRVARDEQTLWDKAMEYLNSGDFDDADESLREILTLPEGGHRGADAARYVDILIPERRQEDQFWTAAQRDASSKEPGHALTEISALDQVLAIGGNHEPGARQKRDALITAIIRSDAERNGTAPAISNADLWRVTQLKNRFDNLVQRGDAGTLEALQQLQSEFKSVADAQGPLAFDARDYVNNVIPQALMHIKDRMAAAESNAPANSDYMDAVKEFNRAVAPQNASALREKVLPLFRTIAQSGSVRAKEAQHYVDTLIPAALNKPNQ
jgi:serine/threonine protein kinase